MITVGELIKRLQQVDPTLEFRIRPTSSTSSQEFYSLDSAVVDGKPTVNVWGITRSDKQATYGSVAWASLKPVPPPPIPAPTPGEVKVKLEPVDPEKHNLDPFAGFDSP